jgi:hypothetical protein
MVITRDGSGHLSDCASRLNSRVALHADGCWDDPYPYAATNSVPSATQLSLPALVKPKSPTTWCRRPSRMTKNRKKASVL